MGAGKTQAPSTFEIASEYLSICLRAAFLAVFVLTLLTALVLWNFKGKIESLQESPGPGV